MGLFNPKRSSTFTLLGVFTSLLLTGCLSVKNDNQLYDVEMTAESGDYLTAYESARDMAAKKSKSHHRLLWRLHEGYLAYWAGQPKASTEAFTKGAEDLIAYESRPILNSRDLGSQMLSLITEPGVKPFKGTVVDGILLHTYKGLAHAQAGDLSSALAELRQAAHRRKTAHDHFKKQLEQSSKKDRRLPENWRERPEVKKAIEDAYGELELLPHYLEFTNPFQIHIEAILSAHQGSVQNSEHARKLWSTLLAMNPNQPLIQQYRDWADQRHKIGSKEPVIHIVHERGQAPELFNNSLSLTLPINGRITGVHLAYASLMENHDHLPPLRVVGSGNSGVHPIANLDSLIKAERKTKDLKLIIEQIGAALTKAIGENQLAKKEKLVGLGLTLFNASVNRADTRSWTTLPKSWEGSLIKNSGEALKLKLGEETLSLKAPGPKASWLLHLKSVSDRPMEHHWIKL